MLDDTGGLSGWVGAKQLAAASADATVSSVGRRFDAWVPLGSSLKDAFAVMLQHDAGWVAVLDQDRYVGVLTPASLHTALRKSVDDGLGVTPEETVLA